MSAAQPRYHVPDVEKRRLERLARTYRAGRLALVGPVFGNYLPDVLRDSGARRRRAVANALGDGEGWAARLETRGHLWHIVMHADDVGLPPETANPLRLWADAHAWRAAVRASLSGLPHRACLQVGDDGGDGDGRVHAHVVVATPTPDPPTVGFVRAVSDDRGGLPGLLHYLAAPPLRADWQANAWRVGLLLDSRRANGGRLPRLAWTHGVPNARTWHPDPAPALQPLADSPGPSCGFSARPKPGGPMSVVFRLPDSPRSLPVSRFAPAGLRPLTVSHGRWSSRLAPNAAWRGASARGSPSARARASPVGGASRASFVGSSRRRHRQPEGGSSMFVVTVSRRGPFSRLRRVPGPSQRGPPCPWGACDTLTNVDFC